MTTKVAAAFTHGPRASLSFIPLAFRDVRDEWMGCEAVFA